MLDTAPATTVYGKITGFRAGQSDTAANMFVQVLLGKRPIVVELRPGHGCEVGGRIELLDRKTMRFYRYSAASHRVVDPGGVGAAVGVGANALETTTARTPGPAQSSRGWTVRGGGASVIPGFGAQGGG